MSRYPSPEQIDLPAPDEISPDQAYYLGWAVQHARLWLALVGSFVVNAILLFIVFAQTSAYKPAVQYVTLEGGYPVLWNPAGDLLVGGTEYVPARLRTVVSNFIEFRYAHDWQNPMKINSALRLMSENAQSAERQKYLELNPRETIITTQTKVALNADYSNWKVTALGQGRFAVTVTGEARINDSVRHTDPNHPLVRPFAIDLVVEAAPASDLNPLGYRIISTGRDIL